tara:strand:+ start:983 stop:1219 length:237 start_codon:yes stop_codon:yes gene_type:complete
MLNSYTFEVKVSTYYSVTTIAKNKSDAIENIQYDYGNRCILNHSEDDLTLFDGIEDLETDTFDIVSLLDTQEVEIQSD